ncbi:ABC transporter permease [Bradyrhizobium sp.]|uniref:ABC transporter permease n=1 Tax=Bradyrhizobium sp. TaxID=376 RepID=UPI0039E3B875
MVQNVASVSPLPPMSVTRYRRVVALARKNPSLTIGLIGLSIIVAATLLAPLLTSYDPYAQSLASRRIPPFWHMWIDNNPKAGFQHWLGTDKLGRDYWARILYGGRISLLIGFTTVVISGLIGSTLGICAGYFGGRVDAVVSFLVSVRLSMPIILIALAVVALHGSSLEIIIMVLGLLLWDRFAVVLRAVTQQVRSKEYVTAAYAVGCSRLRIILQEVLPNVLNPLIVVATIEIANAILFEAALSFLGLGVQPPLPSWGLMLAEGKSEVFFAPWMIAIPGTALFVLVLTVNLLGDGFRDAFAKETRL